MPVAAADQALYAVVTAPAPATVTEVIETMQQIDACIDEADAFYTISFNPSGAEHADEYHDLKVQISQPGLAVRTNTGYYNQP